MEPETDPDSQGGTLQRLYATARRRVALADEAATEMDRWRELIVQARDEGASWRAIAKAAGCSVTRCINVVGGN